MIRYSIIMPVYNGENTISKSIESILIQTFSEWELICIDDGSTDSSVKIIKEYQQRDNRIRIISQRNQGPGIARNNGIANAHGEYIAFLDSDDTWSKDFLQIIEKAISETNSELIFYDLNYCDTEGNIIHTVKQSQYKSLDKKHLIEAQMCGCFLWGMVKVISRKLIIENGISFGSQAVGEEAIFSFDVLRLAEKYTFVDSAIYNYWDTINGQHTKGNLDPWKEAVLQMKGHLEELKCIKEYENGLKAFALKACCISCYRISVSENYKSAKYNMERTISNYTNLYSIYDTNTKGIDFNTKILKLLIKSRLYFCIWVLSRVREKRIK